MKFHPFPRKVSEKATGTIHKTTTLPVPTTIPTEGECCSGAAWVPECGMPGEDSLLYWYYLHTMVPSDFFRIIIKAVKKGHRDF